MTRQELPSLKVSTGWISLSVTGPVDVIMTYRGLAPIIPVRVDKTGLEYVLYISASSLGKHLLPLREKNGGNFDGLKFKVRKSTAEKTAPYEVEEI
jgi:hypothetical protein